MLAKRVSKLVLSDLHYGKFDEDQNQTERKHMDY